MKNKHTGLLLRLFFCGISSGLFVQASPQTVTITTPADRALLTELPSINGTATGNVNYVGISIVKDGSDEEWALDRPTGLRPPVYKWKTGPTGQWLSTTLIRGVFAGSYTWSAPTSEYSLPNGTANLPNGSYWIYAYAQTPDGRRSEQARRKFTIRRLSGMQGQTPPGGLKPPGGN